MRYWLVFVVVPSLLSINCWGRNVVTFEKVSSSQDGASHYDPPAYKDKAKRARYMMHNIEWGAIATISTHYNMGPMSPFSNVVALVDGTSDNSTGTPYMYVTNMDTSVEDTQHNSNVSITMSEMETSYCDEQRYNAETPLCARLTLMGKFEKIQSSEEKDFALNALFSRFPEMKTWPKGHDFFPAKLNVKLIWLIDFFGGATIIPLDEYRSANPLL